MDTRSTDIAPVVKARFAAGLLYAGLALAPSAWAQEEERWVFGGDGDETWLAHVDLNVMADDFTDPGMLRPRILKPDENLLPRLFEVATWHYYKYPFDPYFVDGMPRIWRGTERGGTTRSRPSPTSTATATPSGGSSASGPRATR